MKQLLTIALLSLFCLQSSAKQKVMPRSYQYRVYLCDKKGTSFNINKPWEFLSQKSLDRRKRQGIAVDSTDLPVSKVYLDQLRSLGLRVLGTSRWHNTATVEMKDEKVAAKLLQLSCVDSIRRLYVSPDSMEVPERRTIDDMKPDSASTGRYGCGHDQIAQLGGLRLHEAGFTGKGMTIAILDAGFHNADIIPAFKNIHILATKDFAPRRTDNIYVEHYHGTMVLSTMAMNRPDTMIGSAPDADYVLIRTEDTATETPAEEDSWTMGAEYADSIGVDLINSSLGYTKWDGDSVPFTLQMLDGKTSYVSQTASMLASKGIVLCNSAGNEASSSWHKIGIPADADNIITVGAVDNKGKSAIFSSLGPSQDGRVKPDVCASGEPAWVVDGSGRLAQNYGTSFASPILCGMVACLWQAHPEMTAKQIISLVRSRGDRYANPDNVYGYGIPDFSRGLK